MNIANGVFHFNIQYIAGDTMSYHRYARHVVIPFLHTIASDSRYRISFEMAGSGLAFLADHYPDAITILRDLIDAGNIELISSTYAPTIWVAFPARDLRESIRLNRRVLSRLGLQPSPIFFAQEAFVGYGLRCIGDLFRVVLYKDDYITHFHNQLSLRKLYRLGDLTVAIGSGHIRASILKIHQGLQPELRHAVDSSWPLWYHMGSAHHLVTPENPCIWSRFFADEDWINSSHCFLQQILDSGLRMGTVMESINALSEPSEELPFIPEGSWNASKSDGVRAWMGRLTHPWESDVDLLGLVWRARHMVRQLEDAVARQQNPLSSSAASIDLDEAWRLLIQAESSDPLGWKPLPIEVQSGRMWAENVLRHTCTALGKTNVLESHKAKPRISANTWKTPIVPYAFLQFIGSNGEVWWKSYGPHEQLCDIEFIATEGLCGVQFLRETTHCYYSPSGAEHEYQMLRTEALDCDAIYLPLANGFISLGDSLHLIRLNASGQVAVQLSSGSQWLSITTAGTPIGKTFHWKFILTQCAVADAVTRANTINDV